VNVQTSQTGMRNYYRASIIENGSSLNVFCIKIDFLLVSNKIALVKIDVEGHELAVLPV
jgi:FkbM family methyltransferase